MAEEKNVEGFRSLRSVTRLLVGGLILGSDALQERLRTWEGQNGHELPEAIDLESQTSSEFEPLPDQLPPPGLVQRSGDDISDLRHAMIGLVFESEEQFERGLVLTQKVGGMIGRVLNPVIRPLTKIPNPTSGLFNRLVLRGQSEVDRWISRGREEELNSRQLAQEAATSTVDESITYMAHNPALEELIQTQSVSLARQILDLIRGIAVSADYFFEGVVRYTLRRKPRYLLSPPSPEVQVQATWTLQDIRHEDTNGSE